MGAAFVPRGFLLFGFDPCRPDYALPARMVHSHQAWYQGGLSADQNIAFLPRMPRL